MVLPAVSMECNLAADPELRFAQNGTAVARLRTVANSRKRMDDGTWVDDKTCWIDVSVFGKLAENVAESAQKGDMLTVVGRLVTDEWEDRESGERRSKLNLLADQVAVSLRFRTVRHSESHSEGRRLSQTARERSPLYPDKAESSWGASDRSGAGQGEQSEDPPF